MSNTVEERSPAAGARGVYMALLAAFAMAYGWRYRGTVGHEGGATIPGAMLAIAVCLASRRTDWYKRAAVAGLFGAVGWAWGGSLSYMEQTAYIRSDSFPDVLYGTAVFFFLGALWAGIGGAVLGLAFTLPRSALRRLVNPFVAICAAFLVTYLFLFFNPAWNDVLDRTTAQYFNDADAYAAITVIVVSGLYALVRPKERAEALLLLACGVAWWVGYLALTKFGGLRLGPPYRSEGWGGVLGILVVLVAYLSRTRNRAALMLCLYGLLAGGLAFSMAYTLLRPWAEESVGFFMGLGVALGIQRLERDELAPAEEDAPATGLDVFSVFAMLVAMLWMNLRRSPMLWLERYHIFTKKAVVGLLPWQWFTIGGALVSMLALYALYLYAKGRLAIAPHTAFGKAMLVLILLIWITMAGSIAMDLPNPSTDAFPLPELTLFALATITTALLLGLTDANTTPASGAAPSDARWRVSVGYAGSWAASIAIVFGCTAYALYDYNGPGAGSRLRFGPNAYWRQIEQVVNPWRLAGRATAIGGAISSPTGDAPTAIEFKKDHTAIVTLANGETVADTHTWQHKDGRVRLEWFSRKPDPDKTRSLILTIQDERLYVPWPPSDSANTYGVYEKRRD